jgi:hypothetical protein
MKTALFMETLKLALFRLKTGKRKRLPEVGVSGKPFSFPHAFKARP